MDDVTELLQNFELKYHNILKQLDELHKGQFDEDNAIGMAAASLIAQAALLEQLAAADLSARSLKKDIEFAKTDAYAKLKEKPPGDKKPTETALAHLILQDEEVRRITKEQCDAERDYKHLANVHALLREAHLTFRSIKKVTI
jgi:hypothetical protein